MDSHIEMTSDKSAAKQISFPVRIPLSHPQFPFIVMWSEKAGCTGIVKWFFWQLGLLDEALNYHGWIHNYENDIFKAAPDYLKSCVREIRKGKPVIKFVRNPYRRAFSGYLELCNPKIARPDAHWTKQHRRHVLSALMGYSAELEYTFSFRQYISWLTVQNPNLLDLHLRQQFTVAESDLDVRPHQIEQGKDGMRALEREFGLKDSSERSDLFESEHHNQKTVIAPRPAVSVFDLGIPVRRTPRFQVIEPTLDEYRRDPVGLRVQQYFAEDFIRYGYEM